MLKSSDYAATGRLLTDPSRPAVTLPIPIFSRGDLSLSDRRHGAHGDTDESQRKAVPSRLPAHLHLRSQEGVHALYAAPFPLHCCAYVLRQFLHEQLLVLSLGSGPFASRPAVSLADWLCQHGIFAQPLQSRFALTSLQSVEQLARVPQSHLVIADTVLPAESLAQIDLQRALTDTFSSPEWHTVLLPELGSRLHCETRDGYFTQMVCRDRTLLSEVLTCFLLSCLSAQGQGANSLMRFPPLVQEQLWHYAAHGLAPLNARRLSDGVALQVALGTPDRRVCTLAQSCMHTSEIQRGFTLRWRPAGWEICSTEEALYAQD